MKRIELGIPELIRDEDVSRVYYCKATSIDTVDSRVELVLIATITVPSEAGDTVKESSEKAYDVFLSYLDVA